MLLFSLLFVRSFICSFLEMLLLVVFCFHIHVYLVCEVLVLVFSHKGSVDLLAGNKRHLGEFTTLYPLWVKR